MKILEILIGIPGSGKSTYSASFGDDVTSIIISSDEIRKEINGTLKKQDNPGYIFKIARERTIKALNEGKHVIFDATNINKKDRKSFIQNIKNNCSDLYIKATVIATPYEICLKQNNERIEEKRVPEYAMERMKRRFKMPEYNEGFNEIYTHYNKEEYKYYNEYIYPNDTEIDIER